MTENAFRDVNIAFANELSLICDKVAINVWDPISLANRHPRVQILQRGPGVGGHYIAIDSWFVVSSAPEHARLIGTAREVNDGEPDWVIGRVLDRAAATPGGERLHVACLGLAFKPNIDDIRESPALAICSRLADDPRFEILAVEPHVETLPAELVGRAELVSLDHALARADIVLLLVDHAEFRDAHLIVPVTTKAIDTRGQWNGLRR